MPPIESTTTPGAPIWHRCTKQKDSNLCKFDACNKPKGPACHGYCFAHKPVDVLSKDVSNEERDTEEFIPSPPTTSSKKTRTMCKFDECTHDKEPGCFGYCFTHIEHAIPPEKQHPVKTKASTRAKKPEQHVAKKLTAKRNTRKQPPESQLESNKKMVLRGKELCKLNGCHMIGEFDGYCAEHGKLAEQLSMPLPSSTSMQSQKLKPLLKQKTKVYAAYWDEDDDDDEPEWYPGVITSYKVSKVPADEKYGYVRYYSVKYDDDDVLDGIPDHFVMSADEYLLHVRHDEATANESTKHKKRKQAWKGVKNVSDKKSKDMWAKHVGWYLATIDGKKYSFSTLSSALKAHDASVVREKGTAAKKSELNLPEDWNVLFQNGNRRKSKVIEGRWTPDEVELLITLDERLRGTENATDMYEQMAKQLPRYKGSQCNKKLQFLRGLCRKGNDIGTIVKDETVLDIIQTLAKWTPEEIDQLMQLEEKFKDLDEDTKNEEIGKAIPRWVLDKCSFKTLYMRWETKVRGSKYVVRGGSESKKKRKRKREDESLQRSVQHQVSPATEQTVPTQPSYTGIIVGGQRVYAPPLANTFQVRPSSAAANTETSEQYNLDIPHDTTNRYDPNRVDPPKKKKNRKLCQTCPAMLAYSSSAASHMSPTLHLNATAKKSSSHTGISPKQIYQRSTQDAKSAVNVNTAAQVKEKAPCSIPATSESKIDDQFVAMLNNDPFLQSDGKLKSEENTYLDVCGASQKDDGILCDP